MTLDKLTQVIFHSKLDPSIDTSAARTEFLSRPEYHLVASPQTTGEEWSRGQFTAYIEDGRSLVAFLSGQDASIFASRTGCASGGIPMAAPVAGPAFSRLVGEYHARQLISAVKIYAHVPIHLSFTPSDFIIDEAPADVRQTDTSEPGSPFIGVDRVKEALSTFEASARRKLDPGGRYENIHTLVESLAQQNGLDPGELDRRLDLPQGFTRHFCANLKDGDPSQDVLIKYLSFFGLQEHLYLYKKDCLETLRYLKSHQTIDKHSLKHPPALDAERFKLEQIDQGKDGNGFFVYRLALSSKYRPFKMVVSNPLNLVIGREYQIPDLALPEGAEQHRAATQHQLPNEEELQRIADSVSKAGRKNKKKPVGEPTYEDTRHDAIIGYFRKRGLDGKTAESRYKALETESDILDEFYKYITNMQFGTLELHGYTAKKLIKNLRLDPYEAYLKMAQLRSDPQGTRQWLKYRETDPQYQRTREAGKGGG